MIKPGARVLRAYLAMVAGIVCIAWSAIFVRWTDIPGPASAFYRMLIPAVVLLPTFLFDRSGIRLNWRMLGDHCLGRFILRARSGAVQHLYPENECGQRDAARK